VGRQGPHRIFTEEFKRRAVERMQTADKITELAKELEVRPWYLYRWEAALKGKPKKGTFPIGQPRSASEAEQALQLENRQLREALGKRALEIEFFKGALQKIEARRQSSTGSGETASTNRSGR
jgi:transposase